MGGGGGESSSEVQRAKKDFRVSSQKGRLASTTKCVSQYCGSDDNGGGWTCR